jgi:hypothetical protein
MNKMVQKWYRDRPFMTGYLFLIFGLVLSAFLLDLVMGGAVPGIVAATGIFLIGLLVVIAVPTGLYLVFDRIRNRGVEKKEYV